MGCGGGAPRAPPRPPAGPRPPALGGGVRHVAINAAYSGSAGAWTDCPDGFEGAGGSGGGAICARRSAERIPVFISNLSQKADSVPAALQTEQRRATELTERMGFFAA